jgi:hypothetical protein
MKALMILGSIIGFLIGIGFGLASMSSWPTSLWRGCAAALIAAVLTRWWSRIWLESLRESFRQRKTSRPLSSATTKPAAKL